MKYFENYKYKDMLTNYIIEIFYLIKSDVFIIIWQYTFDIHNTHIVINLKTKTEICMDLYILCNPYGSFPEE